MRPSPMCLPLTLLALLPWHAHANGEAPFGSPDPGLLNLTGRIYFLPDTTTEMPDLSELEPQCTVYARRLDIPGRSFTDGFPGGTDRIEWFGIDYRGYFQIEDPGTYGWRLNSDDGSRLWIDNADVINNDGVHGEHSAEGTINLSPGRHAIRVWYFQGIADYIALQLFVTPPGGEERPFDVADFSTDLMRAMEKVNAEATSDGIRVRLAAATLFDWGQSDLKPRAQEMIQAISTVIGAYPGCAIRIEGHTDSVGSDGDSQLLSERRAEAVKLALAKDGMNAVGTAFDAAGFGGSLPIATNRTEEGRAMNRRVEIYIRP